MANGHFVFFTLGAFALVEGFEFGIVLRAVEGGLEEGRAQDFHAALAHFGLPFPLTAFFQARVVAHEGLEPCGHFAIAARVQDLAGKISQHFGGDSWAEARQGLHQRFGLGCHALAEELINLPVNFAQTRFHFAQALEDGLQGRRARGGELGIGDRISRQRFEGRGFGTHHPILFQAGES